MSVVPAEQLQPAGPWRGALPIFLLLLAAVLLLYRDTAVAMVSIWYRSETFAHAFLVVPISIWLVWRQRHSLAQLRPRPRPLLLLPLFLVSAVWLLAELMVVNAAEHFALVGLVVLAVPAVLGFQVALRILFPLLFLFFAVPFGEFMLPAMMEWTADFTVAALRLSGVPVFREGQNFVIPSGNWSVIDECSGVRYVMASFMVGSLFAYLNYRSYKRRALFMLVALLLPVVANWFRAYMIVMMAHLSGNKIAVGVDHVLYGWVFFGIIMFVMFIVGARWSEPDEPVVSAGASGAGDSSSVAAKPMLATALAAALIVLLPHLTIAGLQRSEAAASAARLQLPNRLSADWLSAGTPLADWKPSFTNPSVEAVMTYAGATGGAPVGVYIAYYRGQSDESKIVSSQNTLVGMRDRQWALPVQGRRSVTVGGRSLQIQTADILGREVPGAAHRPQLRVWRLYWVDGRFIGGDIEAKLAGVLSRLSGRGDEGAGIVLYADAGGSAASDAVLEAFMQANQTALGSLLQNAHDAR